ncbi:hypothetical protein [Bathymodiolus platifrons methanotrophic gill symbiont]|uniref:hypothetical protein n=1 Tax=Bathymodiolus platifrons methanotrophic gill symbiont TaxID=113268 RepID=UPI001C8CFC1D|nr:hypothetical protein [Bathymodiolus platifrons methanotrophic gill symbiont]
MKRLNCLFLLLLFAGAPLADQVELNKLRILKNTESIKANSAFIEDARYYFPEAPNAVLNPLIPTICAGSYVVQFEPCPVFYEIGDAGPSGGLVFYITDKGLHGMEAAPTDQGRAEWGCYHKKSSGADGVSVGTGRENTENNLAQCVSENGKATAAKVVSDYDLNGYNDWYLPSRDDLRGVAIFAKACFGHPSPSKRQKLNATANAFGAPDVLRTCHFATTIVNSVLAS